MAEEPTQYGMKLEMACVWLIGVPLALLAAAVWHFPVQLVVICAGVEELCKSLYWVAKSLLCQMDSPIS